MRYLELEPARIMDSLAWRLPPAPSGRFPHPLEDDWELNVLGHATREPRPALISIPADLVTLSVGTAQVRSGGGWIGGGSGITGAVAGAVKASVLNALTTRYRAYSLLTVLCTEPNNTVRPPVFGFRSIDESDLRDRLAAAIREWLEPLVRKVERKIRAGMPMPDLDQTRLTSLCATGPPSLRPALITMRRGPRTTPC